MDADRNRAVRRAELPAVAGISYKTALRLEAIGEFPPRRKLSLARRGWLYSEIAEWLEQREKVA